MKSHKSVAGFLLGFISTVVVALLFSQSLRCMLEYRISEALATLVIALAGAAAAVLAQLLPSDVKTALMSIVGGAISALALCTIVAVSLPPLPKERCFPTQIVMVTPTSTHMPSPTPRYPGPATATAFGATAAPSMTEPSMPASTATAPRSPTPEVAPTVTVMPTTSSGTVLTYGNVVTEEIKPSGDMDIYAFEGKAGDVALIVAAGTAEAPWLSFKIELFDPEGEPVDRDYYSTYNLTADGLYTISVRESGTRTGPYVLLVKNVALGAGTKLSYGDVVVEKIEPEGDMDIYNFEGKVGDVALIAMSDMGQPSVNLVVELLDPQGRLVTKDDIWVGNTALIVPTLTTDGKYTIKVWVTGQLDTSRTGSYTLLLKNVSAGAGTRIGYGDVVTGEIRPEGDMDVYTFEWKTGDVPVIEVTEDVYDPYFDLHVEVFDSQRNSLAVASASFGGDSTVMIKPFLTTDGTYTIVVREKGHIPGFYTGFYTLSLRNEAAP